MNNKTQDAIKEAVEALDGFISLTGESRGVDGFHLNGDIALWSEFDEEIQMASEALTKLQTILDGDEWQPIETAPKDGRSVLISTKSYEGGVTQVYFCKFDEEFICDDGGVYTDATHWMPLPQPPTHEESED